MCQIRKWVTHLGLNMSISLACFDSRASFLTLGKMHQRIAFTFNKWFSPMNLKMSLKVESSACKLLTLKWWWSFYAVYEFKNLGGLHHPSPQCQPTPDLSTSELVWKTCFLESQLWLYFFTWSSSSSAWASIFLIVYVAHLKVYFFFIKYHFRTIFKISYSKIFSNKIFITFSGFYGYTQT